MGLTITEKILLDHVDQDEIHPGDFIVAKVDLALGNDITAPIAIKEFERAGANGVFDREKIALIPDHFTPNKDMRSANQCKVVANFAKTHEIAHYYEVGRMGIEHALLPELGIVLPGDLIIGADSHTCTYGALGAFATGVGSTDLAACFITGKAWFRVPETIKFIYRGKLNRWVGGKDIILFTIGEIGVDGALYKAMEFCGEAIKNLPMDDRFTICNMAIEAGAKSGIIAPDVTTEKYLRSHKLKVSARGGSAFGGKSKKLNVYKSDKDAKYCDVKEYDISKLAPQVAVPHSPGNSKSVFELGDVEIDQVVIGSCTNGRISDLRMAAQILNNKKVHSRIRLIIIPATQNIYLQAIKEGLIEVFLKAGAVISTPTCGPCLGGHMGVLARGEKALATTNRNYRGRMGHVDSEVYLSNPAVAAASAVKGRIAHPEEVE